MDQLKERIKRLAIESGLLWESGGRYFVLDGDGKASEDDLCILKFAQLIANDCAKAPLQETSIFEHGSQENAAYGKGLEHMRKAIKHRYGLT